MRKWIAYWLRTYADRIDHRGAPKYINWSFTFEHGEGIRFRDDGQGCPLLYYGDDDYERAHNEADSAEKLAEMSAVIDRWLRRVETRNPSDE